jgi:sortase (surface protein transpeptidase)
MPTRTPQPEPTPASPPAPRAAGAASPTHASASRGPFLLFVVGALLAMGIAGAQVAHLPIPGLSLQSGSRHAAASASKPGAPNDNVIHDLNQFRQQYGDPKQADYGRLRIPTINVDAPIGRSLVDAGGQLANPLGPTDVVWYDFGSRKDLGGAPGAGKNAVFAGHVDRSGLVEYANANYSGPGVFFFLDRLTPGDVVEVTTNGKTLRYAVVWAKQVPAETNWNELFSSDVLGDSITIVTCGGDFDYDTHEYKHRLVVRAVRG